MNFELWPKKVEFITWFAFMYLEAPQKIHFMCLQLSIISMSCILGNMILCVGRKKDLKGNSEFLLLEA